MSITSPDTRIAEYAPVVPTTDFPATFPIFDNDDIAVFVDGIEREDFAVSATYIEGVSNNAKAVFAVGVTGAVQVVGARDPRRTNRFNNGGPLPIRDQNLALDTIEAEVQEIHRQVERAHKAPFGIDGGVFDAEDMAEAAENAADAAASRAAADAAAAIALAAANNQLVFDTRALAASAAIPLMTKAVRLNGDITVGDGRGGVYIDTNNGNSDTFLSSGGTARTWYLAEDITAKRIKRTDQFPILKKLEIDRDPSALPQNPVYTPTASAASSRLLINGNTENGNTENGSSPVYHRHFGSIAVDHRGIVHLVYRRALGHAGYFPGVICHVSLDHNGYERSAETVIMEPALPDGRDLHSPMLTVLPNGRMIMTYTELNTTVSGSACLFKCMHTDDYGATWSSPVTFANMLAARTFGQPRVAPSNVAGERYMLLQPWYGPGLVGARRVGLYESHDDGVTWIDRTVPIYEGSDMGLNEASIAILNARVWFAACRKNDGKLCWFVTTNGGTTWTAPVEASWSTSTWDVAPSLDVVTVDGVDHLLLGYCDRNSDQTKWRWAKASSLMANAEVMGSALAVTSAADMISSSGYQIPVIYPNGQMLFVEFKEYVYGGGGISDPVGTDVRLVWANPASWCAGRDTPWTPSIKGKTVAGTPGIATALGNVSKTPHGKVTVTFALILNAVGGMTGGLQIPNLPYTVKGRPAIAPL